MGTNPQGVAFDGVHIWVANGGSNNITRLKATDGSYQGTFEVGFSPFGVAFDGANIWVTNYGSANVTKLPGQRRGHPGNLCGGEQPNGRGLRRR